MPLGTLLRLLALPVTAPTNGLLSVFRTIRDEVDQEAANPQTLRQQLAALQTMLEAGEIDEDTYDELEEALLDLLEQMESTPDAANTDTTADALDQDTNT